MSSTGKCFDIGGTTRSALHKFSSTGKKVEVCGDTSRKKGGNGSLMRLAPVAMAYALLPPDQLHQAIEYCGLSSTTTHASPQCIDSCRFYGGLIIGALKGESKQTLLSPYYSPLSTKTKTSYDSELDPIVQCLYKQYEPPKIRGTGYVINSMEAALWAFHKTNDFKSGCLAVVNLGGDADTTAAIYGMLAGAHYGVQDIPTNWSVKLAKKELLNNTAEHLMKFALCQSRDLRDVA
jgi:ADP-ribosyl-[dinitrogen reductase] hydrolase